MGFLQFLSHIPVLWFGAVVSILGCTLAIMELVPHPLGIPRTGPRNWSLIALGLGSSAFFWGILLFLMQHTEFA
jgi:hypothetical protein